MPRTGSPISIEKLSNTLQRITSDPMTLSACAIRNLHTAEAFVSFYGIRESANLEGAVQAGADLARSGWTRNRKR